MINIIPMLLVVTTMQVAQPVTITTPELEVQFTPRTPNQMGSFYEARGFPAEMRSILKQQCIITVRILNTSQNKIWLDLKNWEFFSNDKPIHREHRDYWKKRWQEMNIPLSKQSTFRWTLLPEALDYLPGEREGGNIALPFTNKAISIRATFVTGDQQQGKTITIRTDKLFCAEDTP